MRWVAAIGTEATTELLKAIQAARCGESIRRPARLSILLTTGLVAVRQQTLCVPDRLPQVPSRLLHDRSGARGTPTRSWRPER